MSWTKPPSDKKPTNPTSLISHYCRACEQEFISTEKDSAHVLALSHFIREHNEKRQYVRCTKDCELRAQAEEIAAGHRMYGPGAPKGASSTDYDRLFPEDD